jgi:hypothetical protein
MNHTLAGRRRRLRALAAIALAFVSFAASAPVAAARDSTFTISLTLRGSVSPDVGFSLAVDPGSGNGSFCVSKAERQRQLREDPAHDADVVCRSGRTYTIPVVIAEGEAHHYDIFKFWPRTARVIWSGTLAGDDRNHRLSYVYVFGLPATDTAPGTGDDGETGPLLPTQTRDPGRRFARIHLRMS